LYQLKACAGAAAAVCLSWVALSGTSRVLLLLVAYAWPSKDDRAADRDDDVWRERR
jgi:hypothetical protein